MMKSYTSVSCYCSVKTLDLIKTCSVIKAGLLINPKPIITRTGISGAEYARNPSSFAHMAKGLREGAVMRARTWAHGRHCQIINANWKCSFAENIPHTVNCKKCGYQRVCKYFSVNILPYHRPQWEVTQLFSCACGLPLDNRSLQEVTATW